MAKTPKKTAPIIKKDISVSRLPAVRGKNPIIHLHYAALDFQANLR